MSIFKKINTQITNLAPEDQDPDEQFKCGLNFEFGYGVTENLESAVYWYKTSAEQGHIKAQAYLAWMYSKGKGIEKDYERSLFWYSKASKQGDKNAQSEFVKISNSIK